MPRRESDSPSSDGAQLVAALLARIDGLMAQIAGRDERIDELLAQVKALNARIAELEAKRGGPPKTPDNSSCRLRAGRRRTPSRRRSSGGARAGPASRASWPRNPTRRFFAEHCACGAVLSEAGQELAKEYDHIDIPPIRPITTRVELFRATCPCCKVRVTASVPADMPEGTPFGPGIASMIANLHGCQMISFKRLTEVRPSLLKKFSKCGTNALRFSSRSR